MRRWTLWLACVAALWGGMAQGAGLLERMGCAIPLKGAVDVHLVEDLNQRLRKATQTSRTLDERAFKAELVVLDLGLTTAPLGLALTMAEQVHEHGMESAALVRKPGSAASTLMALACDHVFLEPGASLTLDTATLTDVGDDAREKLLAAVEAFSKTRPRLTPVYRGLVDPALEVHAVLEKGQLPDVNVSELLTKGKSTWRAKYTFLDGPTYRKRRDSLEVKAYEVVSEAGRALTLSAEDADRLTVTDGVEESVGAVASLHRVPGKMLVTLHQSGPAPAAPKASTMADEPAKKPSRAEIGKTGPVVIIPLDGMVGEGMHHSIERRLQEAAKLEPAVLVFEMDTYGGRLDSALAISDLIFDLEKPHTIAFVNDKAISAGALISVACDEIIMTRGSEIGDCQVVSSGGEKVGSEKIDTVLRARFRSFCKDKYPLALAEAMVTQEIEVYRVTTRDGKTEYLTGKEWTNLTAAKRARYMPGSEELVLDGTHLLTMTDTEAKQYGFSTATVNGRDGLLEHLGLTDRQKIVLPWTWSELLVRWLDRVGPILLTLGILGILIELKTPGFGIPGILGLALVAVFFIGQHAAGMAEAWEIVLFAVGVGLVAIEVFVIPGFGFVGMAGLLCMLASVILALQPFFKPSSPADWAMFEVNMISVGAVTLGVFIGAVLIGRYLHRAPYLGKLVLAAPPPSTVPAATSPSVRAMPLAGVVEEAVSGLVGRQGRATSLLRPAGRAEFDGKPMDVVTQGEFIQPGEPIEIAEVHGNRVVVRRRPTGGS